MVESTLEGDLNVEGAKARTRRLPQRVHRDPTSIRIAGDAPADKLREVVERGTDRSVVFDSISAGVPISVDVTPSDRQRDLTDPDPDGRARAHRWQRVRPSAFPRGTPMTADDAVVGARRAGSATAMLLARAGMRVLLLDRAHLGTDTPLRWPTGLSRRHRRGSGS